jgi:hypothetical protein
MAATPQAIFGSIWLISKKYSPLKPFGQMNQNLVGRIYGRSSIKIAIFHPNLLANMTATGNSCF